jgi:hypothetical protein
MCNALLRRIQFRLLQVQTSQVVWVGYVVGTVCQQYPSSRIFSSVLQDEGGRDLGSGM